MGDEYSKREAAFVLFAGALISFNTGYVNGSCLSGLVSPNSTKTSVAGFTSRYTRSSLNLGDGNFGGVTIDLALIGSYFLGAFLSGLITPKATPFRIEPTYGPTFLIGGLFLTAASFLSANEIGDRYIFCCAAAAAGIQNGIASIFSKGLVRCSLTGSTTDIGITLGQILRGNRKQQWKALVLLMVVSCFWLGGLISFYGTRHFRNYSLYFNAGLFFFIGASLVLFLVEELHITVKQAILGTWERTKAISWTKSQRQDTTRTATDLSIRLENICEEGIDSSDQDRPDHTELQDALDAAGVIVKHETVVEISRLARNRNGGGEVTKEEWTKIAELISGFDEYADLFASTIGKSLSTRA